MGSLASTARWRAAMLRRVWRSLRRSGRFTTSSDAATWDSTSSTAARARGPAPPESTERPRHEGRGTLSLGHHGL